jgi:uncharacterized protein YndB with AHSA1/START domain
VPAPRDDVWTAWTTRDGVTAWFAPHADVEPRPGGAYELYFLSDAPLGARGSEGCVVLAMEPPERFSFSWNFPPHMPSIRNARTRVDVRLEAPAGGAGPTRVTMRQSGWRAGEDWDAGYDYFDRAWGVVLDRLRRRFADGPIDWTVE